MEGRGERRIEVAVLRVELCVPGRVRAGFRHARETAGSPASPAKPGKPGPGRPKGSKNTRKAPRHHVGKRNPKPGSRHVKAAKKAKQTG